MSDFLTGNPIPASMEAAQEEWIELMQARSSFLITVEQLQRETARLFPEWSEEGINLDERDDEFIRLLQAVNAKAVSEDLAQRRLKRIRPHWF